MNKTLSLVIGLVAGIGAALAPVSAQEATALPVLTSMASTDRVMILDIGETKPMKTITLGNLGLSISALNASNLTTGTLPTARLPSIPASLLPANLQHLANNNGSVTLDGVTLNGLGLISPLITTPIFVDLVNSGLIYHDGLTHALSIDATPYASLNNPTFAGNPTAPTKTAGDNSTSLATTAYVATAVSGTVPTTRTVAGHALSADVTVSKSDVGLGNVENTALSTWPGSSNLTTGAGGTFAAGAYAVTSSGGNGTSDSAKVPTFNGTGALTASAAVFVKSTGSGAQLRLYHADNSTYHNWTSPVSTTNRTIGWPDAAGTVALEPGLAPAFASLTDGATITVACDTSKAIQNSTVTLGGNRTLAISGATSGMTGVVIVKQDATGGRTLALPSGSKVVNGGSGAITLSSTANAIDILSWLYDGTNYFWTYGATFN